ncbi:ribosome maturation factor RimM [Candidatus Ishikawella capsulata]|uniref:Ribosome maturation factor RimM n=1 Tax=Candidatus Ishikawaella capsulata Mpkobe TaxID=476281 RepID=C5WDI5_9ENTR|nr:ribosome maturation factor RimM [Candidatus Ishikawaella capsulata]BAH83391.1 16S rRNA-processing protein [Candidatus Ishikawaella capsulata Mpkobe]
MNDKIYSNRLVIGKFTSAYSIRGWLKLRSFTESMTNVINYQPWLVYFQNSWKKITVEKWKFYKNSLIVKIQDINDRSMAERLTNYKIMIETTQLPILDEGYYWKDLIGCTIVHHESYHIVGRVINLMETGSNDVLVVHGTQSNSSLINEQLIPFIKDRVIKKVNLLLKIIEVDWDQNF